jgi:hypothetical protein
MINIQQFFIVNPLQNDSILFILQFDLLCFTAMIYYEIIINNISDKDRQFYLLKNSTLSLGD